MKSILVPLSFCACLQCAAQAAAPAAPAPARPDGSATAKPAPPRLVAAAPAASAAAEPRSPGEPDVRHTVIEDDNTRIEELNVRGVPQRIVVTSKGGRGSSYEIITGDGSRDLSDGVNTSRGAAGKRVWRVLNF
ncbi:MAG: hypothetical protein ABIV63_04345 [Caldimonas sp.]